MHSLSAFNSFRRAQIFLCLLLVTAKDEKIAHFKETISTKDKEITGLKEKLSGVTEE